VELHLHCQYHNQRRRRRLLLSMPSEELLKKKTHLKALEEFIAGPAYNGFLVGIEEEIRQLELMVLDTYPADLGGVFKQCGIRGQIECLASMLDRFINAMEELKDKIADLEDEEGGG
jgi:hypothetical protein